MLNDRSLSLLNLKRYNFIGQFYNQFVFLSSLDIGKIKRALQAIINKHNDCFEDITNDN